jgi:hypothetical protein
MSQVDEVVCQIGVVFAVQHAIHGKGFLVERIGPRVVSQPEVNIRQASGDVSQLFCVMTLVSKECRRRVESLNRLIVGTALL